MGGQTPLAWHRPFGARSFVSPSKKNILGGPERLFRGGTALPSFGPALPKKPLLHL